MYFIESLLYIWRWSGQGCVTQQRNLDLCIPRKGIARPQSQIPHSCVCERSKYIFTRSAHIFSCSRIGKPIRGIYKCSKKHERRNWDWSCAAPFLGIFVSNFRYRVFALNYLNYVVRILVDSLQAEQGGMVQVPAHIKDEDFKSRLFLRDERKFSYNVYRIGMDWSGELSQSWLGGGGGQDG